MRKTARKSGNQSFTFFALLPPYLGVSDSLAYLERRGLKRSIAWYKEFLISCLVARYSAFFGFNPWKSFEIHGNPWKYMEVHGNPCRITRSTLQNLICYRMSVSRASGTPCGSVFGRFCVSRCQIGVTLGSIFMKIMEDNGRKVKNGCQKWHIGIERHV